MEDLNEVFQNLANKLQGLVPNKSVVAGFDGIVDEITQVVVRRDSHNSFEKMRSITDFADQIGNAKTIGANIEIVAVNKKLGGNGPILSNGLLAFDFPLTYIGTLGSPNIHPLFADFASRCSDIVSVADPSRTICFEFIDGKLFLCNSLNMERANWENIVEKASLDFLKDKLGNCSLICMTDWTLLPHLNSIAINIGKVLKATGNRETKIFVDIANPARRSDSDLLEYLNILKNLQRHNDVYLGLNEAENSRICRMFNLANGDAKSLCKVLEISCVCLHSSKKCSIHLNGQSVKLPTFFNPNPKFLTGAGDNFNSGLCIGILSNFFPTQILALAIATSAFFVENGFAANKNQLSSFIQKKYSPPK